MNSLAEQVESPEQAAAPAYHHPELKARYLKELTTAWMRKDYDRTVKVIIAHTDRLKSDHSQETLGDCVAYYLMIGSTPPIADLERARSLRASLSIERPFNPFFDFEGEKSILTFVEATVREHLPSVFKRVHREHLARVAAQEANPDTKSVLNSGTYRIGD